MMTLSFRTSPYNDQAYRVIAHETREAVETRQVFPSVAWMGIQLANASFLTRRALVIGIDVLA